MRCAKHLTIAIFYLAFTTLLIACSDSSRSVTADLKSSTDATVSNEGINPASCPTAKPEEGTSCTAPLPTEPSCSYLIEKCPCAPMPDDLHWHCYCDQGSWKCNRDYDCYPCAPADLGPDSFYVPEGGAIDVGASTDACGGCKGNEVCVQLFDGTCQTSGPTCVKVAWACQGGQCTPDCEKEFCGSGPYQCQTQVPCGTEKGATVNCYGP